jgi:adenylate kinase family enzyme
MQGDSWIIDGDYNRTYAVRFEKCDTVIFLDYSEKQCMEGIRSRVGKVRADMPWVENELSAELVELVKGYRVQTRPKVLELIAAHRDVECRIFNRREQADAWLRSLPPQL